MKRRRIVLGAGAVVATAAGVGTGLLMRRREPVEAAAVPASPIDPWSMSFTSLNGSSLALATLRGRPLLLNFWATWCGPCATEMPLLDRFAGSLPARGWGVLALAVDEIGPVRRFVADRALHLPVALAGVDGLDLSRQLGNSAGALPFTVVFDRAGGVFDRRLGILDSGMLDRWLSTAG